ncbi:hypothetical protein [Arenibacter sp. S6351L]|uniref:hypothetical protein n=1 Tax=Arenibacter sp. S6351L TaxID=2926407 RepID=UPI001FF50590|nr:hypothetical protein [Arenibacter sp. S6351L]MCK0135486.1 hypothetical protein [Arenibacter sp. S6351L]
MRRNNGTRIRTVLKDKKLSLPIRRLAITRRANIHSTLFRAEKTNRPIPKPKVKVTPGARNFNHASIKLMALTKPIHRKTPANANGYFKVVVILKA